MKKLLIVVLCLISIKGVAQIGKLESLPIDSESHKVVYSAIVKIDSANAPELYSRGQQWFTETFKSGKEVMQLQDKDNGKLIGKGFSEISISTMGLSSGQDMYYTVSIFLKNGKYKVVISDFYFHHEASEYGSAGDISVETFLSRPSQPGYNKQLYYQLDKTAKQLIASLQTTMSKKTKDW